MEVMLKKLEQRYRRAKGEMVRWDELQSRLLSQFGNAAAIIQRLPVLRNIENYGVVSCVPGIREKLLGKQMEALQMIFLSIEQETMKEFHAIVISLDKISRDANQLVRGGSTPSAHQMQLRIGIRPSISECLDGLMTIKEMHESEFLVKSKVVSALLSMKCSGDDIAELGQLLRDQPNIPAQEVQSIFDRILLEDIS